MNFRVLAVISGENLVAERVEYRYTYMNVLNVFAFSEIFVSVWC